jgi:hypothetical protein
VLPALAAAPPRAVAGTLDGSASGVASFCTTGTLSASGSIDATYLGQGTFTGTISTSSCNPPGGCCGIPSAPYPVAGTFTFAARGGSFTASGSGSAVSEIEPHNDVYPIELALTIEAGTGRYKRAEGKLDLTLVATTFLQTSSESLVGTISGSLTRSTGPA